VPIDGPCRGLSDACCDGSSFEKSKVYDSPYRQGVGVVAAQRGTARHSVARVARCSKAA